MMMLLMILEEIFSAEVEEKTEIIRKFSLSWTSVFVNTKKDSRLNIYFYWYLVVCYGSLMSRWVFYYDKLYFVC